MKIANKSLLEDFVQKHTKALKPINKWVEEVIKVSWKNHNDLKASFPSADFVGNGRYVFNIGGNNYRLIAVVIFVNGVLVLRFIGTHAEYDKIKKCSEV